MRYPTTERHGGTLNVCQQVKEANLKRLHPVWVLLYDILSSAQFSRSVVSDSLWHHGLQHTRPPCPSPTPGAWSNSRPSSRWCHPAISSSVVPFFSSPQSFPASGSFPMSQFFTSGGQRIGVSASALSFQWIFRVDFLWDWLVWSLCSPSIKAKK